MTVRCGTRAPAFTRETISGSDGSFIASGLVPGTYEVAAELSGFKKFQRRDLILEVGKTATIDIKLEVGGIEQTVTVTGESPLVDVTSKEIGGNITQRNADAAAERERQLHRLHRPAAGHRSLDQHRVVRLGLGQCQRPGSAQQQLHG